MIDKNNADKAGNILTGQGLVFKTVEVKDKV